MIEPPLSWGPTKYTLMQIILVLHEWRSGVIKSLDGNLTILSQVAVWEQVLERCLQDFKRARLDEWLEFSKRVHNCAQSNHRIPEPVEVFEMNFGMYGIKV